MVRIVDATEHTLDRRLFAHVRLVLVEHRPPRVVIADLDPGDDERGHRPAPLTRGHGNLHIGETSPVSVIRDAAEADIPIFFEHQARPGSDGHGEDAGQGRGSVHGPLAEDPRQRRGQKKTILFEGEVAGNVLIFERGGKRLVGYWIGREFWGKGLASKGLAELLAEETTRPLYAYAATSNVGSMRVLEKCGFTLVGRETEFDEALGEEIEEALYVLEA